MILSETLCPSQGVIPLEYLLVKTTQTRSKSAGETVMYPQSKAPCVEGLFLSALLQTGLNLNPLPSFYLSPGCK